MPSPLITFNWLEKVLHVGQRVKARGFQHSQQVTERKELAQHAQKLLVPAENKTNSYIQQWKDKNQQNSCTLGFKVALYGALFIHLSLNYFHYGAIAVMFCNDKNLQIKP